MSQDYRIVELSTQECWEILDRERFGRLAVAVNGDPDIFPINFLVDDQKLLMRTAPGTTLTELVINSAVAVEALEDRVVLAVDRQEGCAVLGNRAGK